MSSTQIIIPVKHENSIRTVQDSTNDWLCIDKNFRYRGISSSVSHSSSYRCGYFPFSKTPAHCENSILFPSSFLVCHYFRMYEILLQQLWNIKTFDARQQYERTINLDELYFYMFYDVPIAHYSDIKLCLIYIFFFFSESAKGKSFLCWIFFFLKKGEKIFAKLI